ncbi:MAG: amidase family protein [Desulfobacterales bacterium]
MAGVKYGARDASAASPDGHVQRDKVLRLRRRGPAPDSPCTLSAGYYDAYYKKASQIRTLIKQDFARAFEACDVILAPVTPTPAFKIGENIDDPLTMYLSDIFTLSANLAGIPGLSGSLRLFPRTVCHVGLQLMGNYFDETAILNAAYALRLEPRNFTKSGRTCN